MSEGVWIARGAVAKLLVMSELINVLPVLGAIIVLGTLVLGATNRPEPKPVRVKSNRR